jgi:hypothetical protein
LSSHTDGVSVVGVASGGQTRARFLGTGAAAIGGAALAGAWRVDRAGASSSAAAANADTTYVEGAFDPNFSGEIFHLELDGAAVGWIKGVQGGVAFADVVTEKLGGDHIAKKHIAGVKYEDISVSTEMGTVKGFYNWIKASFDHAAVHKNGSVVGDSAGLKQRSSGDFFNALITEIGMPALDAASKDAAKMTIKLTPEYTRVVQRVGKTPLPKPGAKTRGNWKLEIDGIDARRVSKIDAFTWKQSIELSQSGAGGGAFAFEPGKIDIPNLSVYMPPDAASPWVEWQDDFLINGNNGDDKERSGSLIFFNDAGDELGRFTLSHLGLFKLTPEKVESGSEAIRRVKAEMYCEDMSFKFGTATWA